MAKKIQEQFHAYVRDLEPEKKAWLQRYLNNKNIYFAAGNLSSAQLTEKSFKALQNASRVFDYNLKHGKTTLSITKTLKKRLKSLATHEKTEMISVLDRLISGAHLELTALKQKHKSAISKLESEMQELDKQRLFYKSIADRNTDPVIEKLEKLRIEVNESGSDRVVNSLNNLIKAMAVNKILPEGDLLSLEAKNDKAPTQEHEEQAVEQDNTADDIKKHQFELKALMLCLRNTNDIKGDRSLLSTLTKLKQSIADSNS